MREKTEQTTLQLARGVIELAILEGKLDKFYNPVPQGVA